MFQSPPDRGSFCDSRPRTRGVIADFGFSPLLIGDRSATTTQGPSAASAVIGFQSPPDRGSFCDSTDIARQITRDRATFQSPPDRGSFCDARRDAASKPIAVFQSPPDRGSFCDTGYRGRDRRLSMFQSPPDRGSFCDRHFAVAISQGFPCLTVVRLRKPSFCPKRGGICEVDLTRCRRSSSGTRRRCSGCGPVLVPGTAHLRSWRASR